MVCGIKRKVDALGRIKIPNELIKEHHLNDTVILTATEQGVLITNPQYKVVKIEEE